MKNYETKNNSKISDANKKVLEHQNLKLEIIVKLESVLDNLALDNTARI